MESDDATDFVTSGDEVRARETEAMFASMIMFAALLLDPARWQDCGMVEMSPSGELTN